jgi:predicted ArsR family transcriptional regulator
MENSEFKTFTKVFAQVAASSFGACESFCKEIEACEDENKFRATIRNWGEEIATEVCPDIKHDLEEEVEDLERLTDHLESELEDIKERYGLSDSSSLHFAMKMETFLKNHERFDPWEFEKIMEGK